MEDRRFYPNPIYNSLGNRFVRRFVLYQAVMCRHQDTIQPKAERHVSCWVLWCCNVSRVINYMMRGNPIDVQSRDIRSLRCWQQWFSVVRMWACGLGADQNSFYCEASLPFKSPNRHGKGIDQL